MSKNKRRRNQARANPTTPPASAGATTPPAGSNTQSPPAGTATIATPNQQPAARQATASNAGSTLLNGAHFTHQELSLAHQWVWFGILALLGVRLATLVALVYGHSLVALVLDYLLLIPIYYFATKPIIVEVLAGMAIFGAVKDGGKDIEETAPALFFGLNKGILIIFFWIFMVPDTVGFLMGAMPGWTAALMVVLGVGLGIVNVLLGGSSTLVLRTVVAAHAAILTWLVTPALDLGDGNLRQIRDFIVEYRTVASIVVFFTILGITNMLWGKAKETGKWVMGWKTKTILKLIVLALLGWFLYSPVHFVGFFSNFFDKKWKETATAIGRPIEPDKEPIVESRPASTTSKLSEAPKQQELTLSGCTPFGDPISFEPSGGVILGTWGPGKYLIEVNGTYTVDFYNNGRVIESYTMNPDGVMQNGSNKGQTWISGDTGSVKPTFTDKPYGGIIAVIKYDTGGSNVAFVGSQKTLELRKEATVALEKNVFTGSNDHRTGKGTVTAIVKQCR